jgi:NhaA family Na+:H+ antiporter
MEQKIRRTISLLHPRKVSKTVLDLSETLLRDESIGGKLIIFAAALSMLAVNSPLGAAYEWFWHQQLSLTIADFSLSMDLRHWINEGLMAFFFLVVGLEIKREVVKGELRSFRTALLPIGAAIGGMVMPALVYQLFNFGTGASNGWGIPIATDIAFAVAVLALLGKRVPLALKIFLLTLAIADDIGAITVIALFYGDVINTTFLVLSLVLVAATAALRKPLTDRLLLVVLIGIMLWISTHLSGIHASIVGAVMGFLAPMGTRRREVSVAERIEKGFLPFTTFIVLPLFAFANAGFILSTDAFTSAPRVLWGVALGLMCGKVIGITLASWLLLRTRAAELPSGVDMRHIVGAGFIAGIGFTVSIFVTELAFNGNPAFIEAAKAGIFIASFISAVIGSVVLLRVRR